MLMCKEEWVGEWLTVTVCMMCSHQNPSLHQGTVQRFTYRRGGRLKNMGNYVGVFLVRVDIVLISTHYTKFFVE